MRSSTKWPTHPSNVPCNAAEDRSANEFVAPMTAALITPVVLHLSVLGALTVMCARLYALLHLTVRGLSVLVAVAALGLSVVLCQIILMTRASAGE